MASHAHDNKLLIHFFQESLMGASHRWYMSLEHGRIQIWRDLTEVFHKQYKYNMDMVTDCIQLQNKVKKENEAFMGMLNSPFFEKELVTIFINTLQSPFYDRMIGNISSNFSDLVIIGERVKMGARSGKTVQEIAATNTNKPFIATNKRKEGETDATSPLPKNHIQPRYTYHP
ncbi:hypothetical protein CR513_52167, partial [Mucuna pruriens]